MSTITTVGLDIAKSVFQVHGVDAGDQGGYPPSVEASRTRGASLSRVLVARPHGHS